VTLCVMLMTLMRSCDGATTVFHDDFNGGNIDGNKWKHDKKTSGLGFEMYTPEHQNSYVKEGKLYICPTFTEDRFGAERFAHGSLDAHQLWGDCEPSWGGGENCHTQGHTNRPIMSASLRSKTHIKYGRVEVKAKLPIGDWIWPAIWMMPTENHYGGWPQLGEIDMMETAGNLNLHHPNGRSLGVDMDQAHIHYGNARIGDGHARHEGMYNIPGTNFGANFHTYWLDWTADHIKVGVDSHTVMTVNTPSNSFWHEAGLHGTNIWANGGKNAPFDRPFYLILDVAVGGPFFWGGMTPKVPWTIGADNDYQQFWNNRHQWQATWKGEDKCMKVDSVKMTQY